MPVGVSGRYASTLSKPPYFLRARSYPDGPDIVAGVYAGLWFIGGRWWYVRSTLNLVAAREVLEMYMYVTGRTLHLPYPDGASC